MSGTVRKSRLHLLDSIRGLTLFSMIIYHGVWDIVNILDVNWRWFRSDAAFIWQQSICWTFILLSGFCVQLGSNLLRRGLLVFGGGVLISVITVLLVPSSTIICGVLTLIGSCMLLSAPLSGFLRKIPPAVGIILSFVLFIFTRNINRRVLGFGNFDLLVLPDFLYKNVFTAYLGFPPAGFFSTDYFSLLPWAFLFFCGYFLFSEANRYGLNERLFSKGRIPMLSFMGRHSLIIYLLHQPVLYGVCLGIEMFK